MTWYTVQSFPSTWLFLKPFSIFIPSTRKRSNNSKTSVRKRYRLSTEHAWKSRSTHGVISSFLKVFVFAAHSPSNRSTLESLFESFCFWRPFMCGREAKAQTKVCVFIRKRIRVDKTSEALLEILCWALFKLRFPVGKPRADVLNELIFTLKLGHKGQFVILYANKRIINN